MTINKVKFIIPDKYFNNPDEEPIIGTIRCLREQGKDSEFLGFHENPSKIELIGFAVYSDNYVVLIDGIKYHGGISGRPDTNYCATFSVVGDEDHDYVENYLNKRVSKILEALGNGK